MKELTVKQEAIMDCLEVDPNMSIKDIIQEVNDMWEVNVSERHIRRVRKMFFQNKKNEGIKKMESESKPEKDFWEVEIECVSACSKVKEFFIIKMSAVARRKIKLFMSWSGSREWLAYLVGERGIDSATVIDIILPDQDASSTLVNNVNCDEYNKVNIIGVIHSHHEMGAGHDDKPSFSSHDANFINGNHNLSLLVGKNGNGGYKITGQARVKTACGAFMVVRNIRITELEEVILDEEKLKSVFVSKINNNRENRHSLNPYHFSKNPYIRLNEEDWGM